jgi:hypothetical protein
MATVRIATVTASGARYVLDRITGGKAYCWGEVVALARSGRRTHARGGKAFLESAVTVATVEDSYDLSAALLREYSARSGVPVMTESQRRAATRKANDAARARVAPAIDSLMRGDLGGFLDGLEKAMDHDLRNLGGGKES